MAAKKQSDIKKELQEKKKEGEAASKKALELAKLAEKTKSVLEGMQGEVTEEAATGMELAAASFQKNIETRYIDAEQKSEAINEDLEDTQQEFDESTKADKADINKLNSLKSEAKNAGVGIENIQAAEKAKQGEVSFLTTESKAIETSQKEIKKSLEDAKKRRQSAQFTYKSKNTLGN